MIDTSPEAVERQITTCELMAAGFRARRHEATADELERSAALLRALSRERERKDADSVVLRLSEEQIHLLRQIMDFARQNYLPADDMIRIHGNEAYYRGEEAKEKALWAIIDAAAFPPPATLQTETGGKR